MLDLAIIIVTWNVHDLIRGALDSLYADLKTSGLNAEIYVIDSASSGRLRSTSVESEFNVLNRKCGLT